MTKRLPSSLRARLLWLLSAAILLTAMVQGAIAYRTARAEADEIFDYHMQQTALSLRSSAPLAGRPGPPDERDPENFDFVVQVWAADGLLLFRSAASRVLPQRAVIGFSDVAAHGSTYRVFSLQTRSQVIQVAQDMAVRRRLAGGLALRTVAPIAAMAPVLMLLVGWIIGRSFAPLSRVRAQVAQRRAGDLDELDDGGLPDEVQPLVRELNLLFARVRTAFDAQQRFVADAAHELRSPLAALKLQAQSLQRAPDADARALAVERLGAGIARAARLVDQMLALARVQAQGPADAAGLEPVVLADLARDAVAEASAAAQAAGVDLGLVRADAGRVAGDAPSLDILLRNLIDNAVKFTPAGGAVDVRVRRDGTTLVLAVDDAGPGIAPDQRERVFDRFYRIAGGPAQGSGLGLAIVRAIATRHGAEVTLSTSDTRGGLCAQARFAALPP